MKRLHWFGLWAAPMAGFVSIPWVAGQDIGFLWKAILVGHLFGACGVAFAYCLAKIEIRRL